MSVLGMVWAVWRGTVYVRLGLIAEVHGSDAEVRFGSPAEGRDRTGNFGSWR